MNTVVTMASSENSQPKFSMTHPSEAEPAVLMLRGAAKPQITTPSTRTPARPSTNQFVENVRPVCSTPMPGMRAGWVTSLTSLAAGFLLAVPG